MHWKQRYFCPPPFFFLCICFCFLRFKEQDYMFIEAVYRTRFMGTVYRRHEGYDCQWGTPHQASFWGPSSMASSLMWLVLWCTLACGLWEYTAKNTGLTWPMDWLSIRELHMFPCIRRHCAHTCGYQSSTPTQNRASVNTCCFVLWSLLLSMPFPKKQIWPPASYLSITSFSPLESKNYF